MLQTYIHMEGFRYVVIFWISKNANEFDVLLMCWKSDDIVVGIISSIKFVTLEKKTLKTSAFFPGVFQI